MAQKRWFPSLEQIRNVKKKSERDTLMALAWQASSNGTFINGSRFSQLLYFLTAQNRNKITNCDINVIRKKNK